jgi:hypothetical protein
MKRLRTEMEVESLPDSRFKLAMQERIVATHAACEGLECDIVADCGGDFILLEEGDDTKGVALFDGGELVDLTNIEERCFEYVELSEDGTVFELYLVTSDAGGPSFFVPNEPWIGTQFRKELAKLTDTDPIESESLRKILGGAET